MTTFSSADEAVTATTDSEFSATEPTPATVTFPLSTSEAAFYLRNCRRPARIAVRNAIREAYEHDQESVTITRELADAYLNGARRSPNLGRYGSGTLADRISYAIRSADAAADDEAAGEALADVPQFEVSDDDVNEPVAGLPANEGAVGENPA